VKAVIAPTAVGFGWPCLAAAREAFACPFRPVSPDYFCCFESCRGRNKLFLHKMRRNKMNKNLVNTGIALALLCVATAGHAQQSKAQAASEKAGIERMNKELGLSPDQKTKVQAIFDSERKKVEAIFEEERKQLQAVQEETRASLQAVLTPEQMNKLEQKMRQKSEKKK
jgi:Spy/CpxP family protein refolding chaperone